LDSFLGLPFFGASGELVGMAGVANRIGGYDRDAAMELRPLCDAIGVMIMAAQRERRRQGIEEALRASESRYQTFVDHVTDGLFLHDQDGRVVDVNRRACEILGYERDELIGVFPTAFNPDVTLADVKANMTRLRAGESLAFDTRHRRKEGSVFPVEVRVRPFWADGRLFALALACDITDRKRTEATLRETQQRLALILEGANIGLWDWDLTTNAVVLSKEWKSQLGYSEDEIGGRYEEWDSRVHPDDLDQALGRVKRAIERCSNDYHMEFRMRHKDGSWRWILAKGVVIAGADGKPARMLGVHIDVTERRLAEEAIRESEAQLRTMSRRVIEAQETERRHLALELHDEIGQVLTTVNLSLESLRPGIEPTYLSRLDESQRVVDQAIEQVRDLSLDLRPASLDMLGLEAALSAYAKRQCARAGICVDFQSSLDGQRLSPTLETVCFRVAQEALTNVIRHANATHCWISVKLSDQDVLLSVRDDGIGFDAAGMRDRALHGCGFGLVGMQERVQLFGGRIDIESASGCGTTIGACFPSGAAQSGVGLEELR
jgi:two-component system sensor histidine kinase UhpB